MLQYLGDEMSSVITIVIVIAVIIVGVAIGWFIRQVRYRREIEKQAGHGASRTLRDRKALLTEMISREKKPQSKDVLVAQLDGVNTALLELYCEEIRYTLEEAGLPSGETLIADNRSRLKPEQVIHLNEILIDAEQALTPTLSESTTFILGVACYYTKQYKKAIDVYNGFLNLNPDSPHILNSRGKAYAELSMPDKALADYNLSLEKNSNNPLALSNRGILYWQQNKHDDALKDFNRSISLREYPFTLYYRGRMYSDMAKYVESLMDFNKALELKPEDSPTFYARGIVFYRLGKYDEALNDFSSSIKLMPGDYYSYTYRGSTYYKLGKHKEALLDYEMALELKPDDAVTLYYLSLLLAHQDKDEEALLSLEKAISLDRKFQELAVKDSEFYNLRNDPRFKKLIEPD